MAAFKAASATKRSWLLVGLACLFGLIGVGTAGNALYNLYNGVTHTAGKYGATPEAYTWILQKSLIAVGIAGLCWFISKKKVEEE